MARAFNALEQRRAAGESDCVDSTNAAGQPPSAESVESAEEGRVFLRDASPPHAEQAVEEPVVPAGERMPWYHLQHNLWAVKVCNLDLCKGVFIVDSAAKAAALLRKPPAGGSRWVFQKYIERPLS